MRTKSKIAAFSLIEVTLAIGIVSFAVLSIVGSLSFGLTTIHDAKRDTTHAEIISQVGSTALQTAFDQMEDLAVAPYYFDQVGRQLEDAKGARYVATLVVASGNSSTYPGASSALSTSAKSVKITVSTVGPAVADPFATSSTVLIVPKS